MTDVNTPPDDITQLTRCYAILAISMPLTFVPVGATSMIAMISLLIGVIWVYVLKKRENPTELVASHSLWMIRTFWISSLFCAIAIGLAGVTISSNANNAALVELNALSQQGAPDPVKMEELLEKFRTDNKPLLLWGTVGYLILPIVYAVARFAKGFTLAKKGALLPNVKTWAI